MFTEITAEQYFSLIKPDKNILNFLIYNTTDINNWAYLLRRKVSNSNCCWRVSETKTSSPLFLRPQWAISWVFHGVFMQEADPPAERFIGDRCQWQPCPSARGGQLHREGGDRESSQTVKGQRLIFITPFIITIKSLNGSDPLQWIVGKKQSCHQGYLKIGCRRGTATCGTTLAQVQRLFLCGAAMLLGRPGLLLALPKQINTSKGQR